MADTFCFSWLSSLLSASSPISQILAYPFPLCRQRSGWRSYSGFACMTSYQCNTGAWSLPTTCCQRMLSWPGSWWRANCWRSWPWWENRSRMRREQLWFRRPGNVSSSAWIMASSSPCHREWSTGVLGLVLNCQESWAGPSQSVSSAKDHSTGSEVSLQRKDLVVSWVVNLPLGPGKVWAFLCLPKLVRSRKLLG